MIVQLNNEHTHNMKLFQTYNEIYIRYEVVYVLVVIFELMLKVLENSSQDKIAGVPGHRSRCLLNITMTADSWTTAFVLSEQNLGTLNEV